ncbi:MAG TPA: molybdate ABC transporter permease subunit [Rhodanobacteraceae bacterium]|nr:molybdate ABC transporter permease subunit [Rhodanobacteraceae bacterium]
MTDWLAPAEWQALALSLKVALVATLAALPPGIALAWWLARRRFVGKPLLETALMLPMILPPVVTGYLLLQWFGNASPVGRLLTALGTPLAFRWSGAALAALVMGLPLLVVTLRTAFEQVDQRLEQAAATLGASPWRVFIGVSLPLARRGLIAGAALTFARAFGEFGATITFVSAIPGQSRTLPVAIYELINQPDGEAGALRLVWVSLAVGLLATLGASLLLARGARARSEPAA